MTTKKLSLKYIESDIMKAIILMRAAKERYASVGQNSRIYRIMDFVCRRYGIVGSDVWKIQTDIINGYI